MYDADVEGTGPRLSTWRTRIALAAILAAGFAIRLGYLLSAVRSPGFRWEDPDGYLLNALVLAGPDGWHWTFDVAKYVAGGRVYALPPLYSIFLSFFALFPGMPLSALVAQVLLSTVTIGLVFMLGRTLHSSTTGLIASAACALSVSAILNVHSTSQEALYIPLLLSAFVLYGQALSRNRGALSFSVAGAVLGLATLTRSMPLFFVVPLVALHVVTATNRREALRQSLAYLAGFAIVVGPYCAGLSRSFGQLTLVDSHAGFRVDSTGRNGGAAPGHLATAAALWDLIARDPLGFLQNAASRARALFYVNGGRQLQIYVVADNHVTAILWKIAAHIGTDALLIAGATLSWLGAVLCRNTRLAVTFVSWAALNILIAAVSGFGGARLRAPFELVLLILGMVVFSGGWRRRPKWVLASATALGVAMAIVVFPQVPRSLRSWPDYGVHWPSVLNRAVGDIHGNGAFNVPAYDGTAAFSVQSLRGDHPVQVDVRAGGTIVQSIRLNRDRQTISWSWPQRGLAFAELRAVDADTRAPTSVRVEVGRR